MRTVFAFCCLAILTSACLAQPKTSTPEAVTARVETTPTVQDGANDPAIWLNAKDPAKSLVLGAASEGGLEVYSLSGDRISSVSGRPVALVDVLQNFSLAGEATDLAVAYDPAQSELLVFAIDGVSGELSDINAGTLPTEGELEGMCTYQSPFSLKFYVFGLTEGLVKQWELIDQDGRVAGRLIREVAVGYGAGHCVAHNRESTLYYAQETVGVWKMSAEPETDAEAEPIDLAGPFGRYTGDVKGLALVEFDQGGYLLVSDADVSKLQVYDLDSTEHRGTLEIGAGSTIDAVEEAEGMAAVGVSLGGQFPKGLLVLTDDYNEGDNTNYKLVSWAEVSSHLNLAGGAEYSPATVLVSTVTTVSPSIETEPVVTYGDSADDPAIWVHPDDPALSMVIGSQKQRGLNVYDMSGNLLQSLPDGRLNNVDVRYNFPLGNNKVDLVAASNRSTDSISIYKVDPQSRNLVEIADGVIPTGMADPYGFCMYRSQSGAYYVYVNDTDGLVKQWQLLDQGNGKVGAKLRREFKIDTQTEGCVADDETGDLYIGEEGFGIWKYSAEPDGGDTRVLVDEVNKGQITDDVEGMSLLLGPDGQGYLVVSIQGINAYAIYERAGDNPFIGLFYVVADEATGVDGISETDGLDVTSANLGPAFPHGAFIAQDGRNIIPAERQNFKYVPWERIVEAMGLKSWSGYDPRELSR